MGSNGSPWLLMVIAAQFAIRSGSIVIASRKSARRASDVFTCAPLLPLLKLCWSFSEAFLQIFSGTSKVLRDQSSPFSADKFCLLWNFQMKTNRFSMWCPPTASFTRSHLCNCSCNLMAGAALRAGDCGALRPKWKEVLLSKSFAVLRGA